MGGIGDVNTEEFRSYWKSFGDVLIADVVRRPEGTSRGFGFVTFANQAAAQRALSTPHMVNGRGFHSSTTQPEAICVSETA